MRRSNQTKTKEKQKKKENKANQTFLTIGTGFCGSHKISPTPKIASSVWPATPISTLSPSPTDFGRKKILKVNLRLFSAKEHNKK
jgi:hypothetical protein